jgi:hypothetical protein
LREKVKLEKRCVEDEPSKDPNHNKLYKIPTNTKRKAIKDENK